MVECAECGYCNSHRAGESMRLPLAALLAAFPYADSRPLLAPAPGTPAALRAVDGIFDLAFAELTVHVRANPHEAIGALLGGLAEIGRAATPAGMHSFEGAVAKAVQAAHVLVLPALGMPDLGIGPAEREDSRLAGHLTSVLGDLSVLAMAQRYGREGLMEMSVTGGDLVQVATDDYDTAVEAISNYTKDRTDEAAGAAITATLRKVLAAEEAVTDCTLLDLLALSRYLKTAEGDGWSHPYGDGVSIVDLDAAPVAATKVIRAFSLDAGRVNAFATPYFHDLGDPWKLPPTVERLFASALTSTWLVYYPFVIARAADGRPIAFVQASGVDKGVSVGYGHKAILLHQLATRGASRAGLTPDARRRLHRSIQVIHADFEDLVAQRFADAGLTTAQRVTKVGGADLPCGEVDVVGAHAGVGRPLVLVAEVKDSDMPLYKVGALDRVKHKLAEAEEQALAKSAWVAANWPSVAASAGLGAGGSTPVIIPLVVMRSTLPPALVERVALLGADTLAADLQLMTTTTLSSWPDRLRAGLMPAERRNGGPR